ncbi:hypothetical protein P8452_29396 [Trifolium repens]|nr:hypothetical protein P8452_29396 [Trifolium repens]
MVVWVSLLLFQVIKIMAQEEEDKATTQGGVADCAYWKDNSVCHDLDCNFNYKVISAFLESLTLKEGSYSQNFDDIGLMTS